MSLDNVLKIMTIRNIENHLERCDARIERGECIEAVRERNRLIYLVIKVSVVIISILCAIYAVCSQL